MSFVHYTVFDDDSEEEAKYSSFVNVEAFEESDDDVPEGFKGAEKGSELNPLADDRTNVRAWDPSENFFSIL